MNEKLSAWDALPADVRFTDCVNSGGNINWIFDDPFIWIGAVDSDWFTPGNWQGGAVPGSTAIAVFNSTSNADCDVTGVVDLSGANGGISIGAAYAGTIYLNSNAISIGSGGFVLASGTFDSGSGTVSAPAGWTHIGGTFAAGTGTVAFTGATTILGTAQPTFNNVTIAGSLGRAGNMNVMGAWTNNGTFTHNSGTVTFTGDDGSVFQYYRYRQHNLLYPEPWAWRGGNEQDRQYRP